ncbi:MAG: DUF255 domain-containing protein, partial [Burkholderiaceae bacterium]|nr:DUF255 domain-containing protein [Burkholderiaceae bacterium]
SGIRLEIDLQGCADGGICYPPMTYQYFIAAPGVRVAPIPEGDAAPTRSSNPTPVPFDLSDLWSGRDDVASIKSYLENAKPFYLFTGFFILGIALAFTPCVLPMLPILSSIVLGRQDGGPISKTRSAYLALAYILGMALLYALAGVLTAALGSGVQRALVADNQNQTSPRTEKRISSDLVFQVVRSSEELERILQRAKAENKPVMLDYYADWCISCKEMEAITFTNPEVAKAMSRFVLVQADVTINSQQSQALLKQFSLYGPPAILFFNGAGDEQKSLRVVGFMAPSRFLERLQELGAK